MTFQELQDTAYGVIGTDHIEKVQIEQDEDIPKFVAIKTKTRFEEKVIKFRLPDKAVSGPRPPRCWVGGLAVFWVPRVDRFFAP
eukprot:symbB.v1.2.020270.t1/scaffold1670.1/size106578/5